jgi:hypothetical protein
MADRTPGLRPSKLGSQAKADQARQERSTRRFALPSWSSVVRGVLHPSRDRATSYVAIGAVGALVATTVAVGVGSAGTLPHLSDVGAWLGNSKDGTAVHVNGLTGKVDGKAALPGMGGHPLQISQDGKWILVLDERTGRVSRIDPSQLTVAKSRLYGAVKAQIVAGGSAAYLVDPLKGTVQQIDPVKLSPRGPQHTLPAPLGRAVADPQGTLWVPVPAKGQVVPFANGTPGSAVKAGEPNQPLFLTLAGGRPVVTNPRIPSATLLSATGPVRQVNLPGMVVRAKAEDVLVPALTEGSVIPVLADGALVLADIERGSVKAVPVSAAGRRLAAPQVLANKVYIPDQSDGSLIVYDAAQAQFESRIRVTGEPGPLETFVRNGLLWVNDENHAAAAVIDADGRSHGIGKYDTKAPSAKSKPRKISRDEPDTPPRDAGDDRGDDEPVQPPAPEPTPTPQPGKPAPPPPANPPGTPLAQSGPGSITIDFQPAAGAQPTGYRLQGAPQGADVKPAQVGPDGPFTFQVTGGDCAREYAFQVVALYAGGRTAASPQSTPVRPCVAPGQPRNFKATPIDDGGHGGDLTWDPPANAGGSDLTYGVTWTGPVSSNKRVNGESTRITGLRNSQRYDVTVSASNAAGAGAGDARAVLDLTPPSRNMTIFNNENHDGGPAVRDTPSHLSGSTIARAPQGASPPVVVHCQVSGSAVQDQNRSKKTSSVWDKLTYNGTTGYMTDVYVGTSANRAEQPGFSPELWRCE